MADTGRQSPLAVNMMGSLLQNTGLTINSVAQGYMGTSKNNSTYTPGSTVNESVLRLLTYAINDGYNRGVPNGGTTLTTSTYNNLISIGSTTIPALGNSPPSTFVAIDPAGVWARTSTTSTTPCIAEKYGLQQGVTPSLPGPANNGYGITSNTDSGQQAAWYPYTGDSTQNPNTGITQWGFLRLPALQAWNEFNYNGDSPTQSTVEYKDFLGSFSSFYGFINDSNQTINVIDNSNSFMDGAYSNMNDLCSADIAGVCLSSVAFGNDLENLGKVIDLAQIETFGMPSNLLINIGKAGAMTQDLSLALLAAGLSKNDIASITSGTVPNWSKKQEQQILGAFLLITGENLAHVLAPLQCKTEGLATLADLLNLQKLFPNSYSSLTVPVYNSVLGLPTNSKTYYLIYENGGLNNNLNSQAIQEVIGTLIPKGTPPIYESTVSPNNFAVLPKGFGSYLDGVIPGDWATAAGAFSYSMRQIKNIENVNFQTFAKVAKGIENFTDLPLVAGTSKPTNQSATDTSQQIVSLGSGVAGTYTVSDFFGSMSGLPYPWKLINTRINQLQTQKLYNIYQQMFLAVTWEQATVSVQYTTGPGPTYTVTGFTITNSGGGYGRGGAPAPTITVSDGSTATVVIGTDDSTAGSQDSGTYGRVVNVILNTPAAPSGTIPTATIQAPPTATLPINSDGTVPTTGTNTANGTVGWASPMNSVVQQYIDQANAEILAISTTNTDAVKNLNTNYGIVGSQLIREQRARYTALSPVQVPKNHFLYSYPSTITGFLDSMSQYSQDTRPHMAAQTIQSISDLNSLGGQSTIAKMREERNQVRLQKLGIEPDNNIPNTLSPSTSKTLLANGTAPGALDGIESPNGNVYTIPAYFTSTQDGNTILPNPNGYYVSSDLSNDYGFKPTNSTSDGDITPILNGDSNPVVASVVPSGPVIVPNNPIGNIVIIQTPPEYDPNNLPPNLDPNYINSTMMQSTPSVSGAIDQVIHCNCDCWLP